MTAPSSTALPASRIRRSTWIGFGLAAIVLIAAVLDTRIVQIGSSEDTRQGAFSPEKYGRTAFAPIQAAIVKAAVDAPALAAAIAEDKAAAGEKYGHPGSIGPIFAVKFSGTAGAFKSGIVTVAVDGFPEGLQMRLQVGPAILGTEVRDATGTVTFGQFTNQIEYQDAGSALNNEVKNTVLAGLDREALSGRKLEGIGVFQLVNPKNWLVTPVQLRVQ